MCFVQESKIKCSAAKSGANVLKNVQGNWKHTEGTYFLETIGPSIDEVGSQILVCLLVSCPFLICKRGFSDPETAVDAQFLDM